MFGVARFILRHKVGAAAVIALGVFALTPSKQDQQPQSANPWATQGPAVEEEPGLIGGVVDTVVDTTVTYLDENDLNPIERSDETVASFENTAAAMGDANARN
jgi:hypothetical protein